MIEAILHSKNVVTPSGIRDAFVLIRDGKITGIEDSLPEGEYPITELDEQVLMPGIIDPHVHINEPGRTEWEGFDTATRAAIAGGITSLVEMPLNASPVTTTVKAFEEKLKAADGKLHANCGFWGGIIPGNMEEIKGLAEKGVWGYKAFLTHSGIDEFPNVTEADLRKVLPVIAALDLPLLVHCELETIKPGAIKDVKSYRQYLRSRPAQWEDDAIALMIRLCEEFNCRTHIVHLSSASSIEPIARAKERGLPLTAETAQHYLYFNAEGIPDGQTAYKCAPPIREKANNDALWEALQSGIIDFVATDHSPAPPGLKETESGNLQSAWGGIASLQLALPVLWTAAKARGCSLQQVATWLTQNPARLPGFADRGKIEKGYAADFVVWDPGDRFTVCAERIEHRHKITPYLNETLYGVVRQTWLNGLPVFAHPVSGQAAAAGKFLHLNKGHILQHA